MQSVAIKETYLDLERQKWEAFNNICPVKLDQKAMEYCIITDQPCEKTRCALWFMVKFVMSKI